MTSVVKAEHSQDFLALVPRLVGFRPSMSLVLVAFRGNRTCGAMRFRLPEHDDSSVHTIATTALGMLCRIPRVDALVPVVYTDEEIGQGPLLPRCRLMDAVRTRAADDGFLVRDALCVAGDGWASYLDDVAVVGPLEQIRASPVHDDLDDGDASLQERARIPGCDLAAAERTARLFRRYRRDGAIEPGSVFLAEEALTWNGDALTPDRAALLLAAVQTPAVRDPMMLQFAFGAGVGIRAFEENLRYLSRQTAEGRSMDEIVAEDLETSRAHAETREIGDLMLGLSSRRPDPERVSAAIEVLRTAVGMAPRSARPAPLCMLAWLSWCLGMGSVAGTFLDRVFEIDAGYSMAGILATLLRSGHLPEWAFAL